MTTNAATDAMEKKRVSADGKQALPVSGMPAGQKSRPKVGETLDAPFQFPDSAFAPLTEAELKEWGL